MVQCGITLVTTLLPVMSQTVTNSNLRFLNGTTGICLALAVIQCFVFYVYIWLILEKNVFSQLVYRLRSVLDGFVPLIEKFRPTGN